MIRKIKKYTINRIRITKTKTKDQIFGKDNYGKFVVITRSRTGSNLLISLLNDHEKIRGYGERFRRMLGKTAISEYNNIFPKKSTASWIGFKLFYYHPLDSDDKTIWDLIKNDKDIKIIHLKRENLLRVYISRVIAGKSNNWLRRSKIKEKVESKRIIIDVDELIADIYRTNNFIQEANDLFKDHSVLNLTFEDLVKNKENTINKIFSFLNVAQISVQSPLKRQNSESIKDLVLNYEELKNKLGNTEFSHFIEEQE